MSKKNYFEPEMEVLEIKMTQMLCASQGGVDEDGESTSDDTPGGDDDF